ncbi:MAG: hypothetical protein JXM79_07580 [Sedimentisphaerales bacterium]|nr:hypothetical protein [Sedimentisphaerales bacterium]
MVAYASKEPVELEVEFSQPSSNGKKYELLIISVSDVQISLGFVMGQLALLVASKTSEDTDYEID